MINNHKIYEHGCVIDKKKNLIIFSGDVNLTLYYIFYNNSGILNQMKSIIKRDEQLEKREMKQKEQELFKYL